MPLAITRADFDDPALAAFLDNYFEETAPTAPPESQHALDLEALKGPSVRMWVGHFNGELVVTGALSRLDDSSDEELKSMCTAPSARGQGLARTMLNHVLDDARDRGVPWLWLETGSMAFFAPAHALYRSVGFTDCEPFGKYLPDPLSTFMTLRL